MLLLVTPRSPLAKAVTFSLRKDFVTLESSFFASTSVLFQALYKDVMISLGENLLSVSPGTYSLAYPRDTSSLVHFPVTVVGSLVSGAREAAGFGELFAKHPSSSSAIESNPLDIFLSWKRFA